MPSPQNWLESAHSQLLVPIRPETSAELNVGSPLPDARELKGRVCQLGERAPHGNANARAGSAWRARGARARLVCRRAATGDTFPLRDRRQPAAACLAKYAPAANQETNVTGCGKQFRWWREVVVPVREVAVLANSALMRDFRQSGCSRTNPRNSSCVTGDALRQIGLDRHRSGSRCQLLKNGVYAPGGTNTSWGRHVLVHADPMGSEDRPARPDKLHSAPILTRQSNEPW